MIHALIDRVLKSIFDPARHHPRFKPHPQPPPGPCSACANLAASMWIERQLYTDRSIRN